jgi:hypothetical protein
MHPWTWSCLCSDHGDIESNGGTKQINEGLEFKIKIKICIIWEGLLAFSMEVTVTEMLIRYFLKKHDTPNT